MYQEAERTNTHQHIGSGAARHKTTNRHSQIERILVRAARLDLAVGQQHLVRVVVLPRVRASPKMTVLARRPRGCLSQLYRHVVHCFLRVVLHLHVHPPLVILKKRKKKKQ